MRPRYISLGLVALLAAMTPALVSGEQAYKPNADYSRPGDFRATGAASNIDRSAEVFDIVDQGTTYTILADRAAVQLKGGKFVTIRDLKDNAKIEVLGEQLSARTILAATVTVLDESGSYNDRASQGYRPGDHVETKGYVTRVDARFGEIDIRTKLGSYVVLIKAGSVIRRYIYVTDIGEVNEGDDINVIGTVDREGRIVAERVQVSVSANPEARGAYPDGKGYKPRSGPQSSDREDTIDGTISCPASMFDRSLAVGTKYGERKVDVPKDADVIVSGHAGSVHDLVKGDRIRATGVWSGSTLVAERIELGDKLAPEPVPELASTAPEPPPAAEPPAVAEPAPAPNPPAPEAPRPNSLTGRIVEIDYGKLELSIDAGMKDTKVDAADASVTRQGSTRRFSELKKGDKVEVKGEWVGDTLKATMLDVVE